jgi:hypothetical protein
VADDVREGWVSRWRAREVYGVVHTERDGSFIALTDKTSMWRAAATQAPVVASLCTIAVARASMPP